LTEAETPSSLLSLRSIRLAHEAHVMPGDRQLDALRAAALT
jgi:hypothetical protein